MDKRISKAITIFTVTHVLIAAMVLYSLFSVLFIRRSGALFGFLALPGIWLSGLLQKIIPKNLLHSQTRLVDLMPELQAFRPWGKRMIPWIALLLIACVIASIVVSQGGSAGYDGLAVFATRPRYLMASHGATREVSRLTYIIADAGFLVAWHGFIFFANLTILDNLAFGDRSRKSGWGHETESAQPTDIEATKSFSLQAPSSDNKLSLRERWDQASFFLATTSIIVAADLLLKAIGVDWTILHPGRLFLYGFMGVISSNIAFFSLSLFWACIRMLREVRAQRGKDQSREEAERRIEQIMKPALAGLPIPGAPPRPIQIAQLYLASAGQISLSVLISAGVIALLQLFKR